MRQTLGELDPPRQVSPREARARLPKREREELQVLGYIEREALQHPAESRVVRYRVGTAIRWLWLTSGVYMRDLVWHHVCLPQKVQQADLHYPRPDLKRGLKIELPLGQFQDCGGQVDVLHHRE